VSDAVSLEKRIETLEGRLGLDQDEGAAKRRRERFLEELCEQFERRLAYVSPKVGSGEIGLADMDRESLAFGAAVYVALRVHGDDRADQARENLERRMVELCRRFPEAQKAVDIERVLIDHYIQVLEEERCGA
jgi:glutathione S-transferase